MSVRAMALCWDLPCPATYNEIEFKSGHKFVLLAYADHADHNGGNIYPAVETIARKTGYDERSVQRLTRDLEEAGILILDGKGPRGTNKWSLPIGGDKLSPLTKRRGDIPSGDIPSGDIPSGDNLSPNKIKEAEEYISISNDIWSKVTATLKKEIKKAEYGTWVESCEPGDFDGHTLTVLARNPYAVAWLDDNVKERVQGLAGVLVNFTVEAG